MKLKHTQAKKARRASAFHRVGAIDDPHGSRFEKRAYQKSLRRLKRDHLQSKEAKTYGEQVVRIQRIRKKTDQFGNPKFILVKHAAGA